MSACHAHRDTDGNFRCECGRSWDADDTDPPECFTARPELPARAIPERQRPSHRIVRLEGPARGLGAPLVLPATLPAGVVAEMDAAHATGGMQAAYAALLQAIWV